MRQRRLRSVVFGLCLTLAAALALPLRGQGSLDVGSIEKTILDELKATRTPGAAIAIVRGEDVLLARGYGVANAEMNAKVEPEMLFRLGSTTKMLTATALNVLAEEGLVKLDAPIADRISGINAKLGEVTAHQLLTHTSGFRDEAPMFGLHDDAALAAGVRAMDDGFLFTRPGDVFSYSNPGYWVAGLLAETVAGKPYADVMRDKVFGPLGMTRTTVRPTMAMTYPLAQGHSTGEKGFEIIRPAADNAASWPAGSVFSNVLDLSRFVAALMNDGRLGSVQALPAAVVRRLTTGYVDVPGREERKYAYGLMTGTYRGVRLLEHGGSRSGYGSLIRIAPDQKVAVIILANRTGASLGRTATRALEMLLPLTAPSPEPAPRPIPMSAAEMSEHAGVYSQTSKPDVELLVKDGALFFRSAAGAPLLAVTRLGPNRFAVTRPGSPSPQEFFLTRSRDGRTLYLHQGTRALRRISGPITS